MSGATEEGHFMRSQAYRSLRNFTRFYMGKEKSKVSEEGKKYDCNDEYLNLRSQTKVKLTQLFPYN